MALESKTTNKLTSRYPKLHYYLLASVVCICLNVLAVLYFYQTQIDNLQEMQLLDSMESEANILAKRLLNTTDDTVQQASDNREQMLLLSSYLKKLQLLSKNNQSWLPSIRQVQASIHKIDSLSNTVTENTQAFTNYNKAQRSLENILNILRKDFNTVRSELRLGLSKDDFRLVAPELILDDMLMRLKNIRENRGNLIEEINKLKQAGVQLVQANDRLMQFYIEADDNEQTNEQSLLILNKIQNELSFPAKDIEQLVLLAPTLNKNSSVLANVILEANNIVSLMQSLKENISPATMQNKLLTVTVGFAAVLIAILFAQYLYLNRSKSISRADLSEMAISAPQKELSQPQEKHLIDQLSPIIHSMDSAVDQLEQTLMLSMQEDSVITSTPLTGDAGLEFEQVREQIKQHTISFLHLQETLQALMMEFNDLKQQVEDNKIAAINMRLDKTHTGSIDEQYLDTAQDIAVRMADFMQRWRNNYQVAADEMHDSLHQIKSARSALSDRAILEQLPESFGNRTNQEIQLQLRKNKQAIQSFLTILHNKTEAVLNQVS